MIRALLLCATLALVVASSWIEPHMDHHEIRDYCCWKRCLQESDIIFMGVGLCDEHHALSGSTYKQPYEYTVDRVVPEAAREMREQHEINQKAKEQSK